MLSSYPKRFMLTPTKELYTQKLERIIKFGYVWDIQRRGKCQKLDLWVCLSLRKHQNMICWWSYLIPRKLKEMRQFLPRQKVIDVNKHVKHTSFKLFLTQVGRNKSRLINKLSRSHASRHCFDMYLHDHKAMECQQNKIPI